jgi:hypothetical protein
MDEQDRVARYAAAYKKLPETPEEHWLVEQSVAALATDVDE